jgi:hypothetical protein
VPGNIAHFDLVVTITLEYTISEGDSSRLHIFYCPNALPSSPLPAQLSTARHVYALLAGDGEAQLNEPLLVRFDDER